jgi:hypothetical protein
MQKISRIYLGNCGYKAAWYDGITFDLVNPSTRLPTDTIINLENGGGKTTLLSLIFSCFETSQDRFLKHIQSKNNHFAEYFANDGLPGFILVEWLMPSKTNNGDAYRLIVGQAVSIQGSHDANATTRVFFSFEERASLGLQDVPAPKLTMAPTANLAEFRQWLHMQQRQHTDNLFFTEKQADWQRHLKDERHIDLDMLRMQVNFSAQEGGFDTGFLNFKNEAGFLSKFFNLTLDEQRAASLRENVGVTCDKLRRKPHYKRALDELNRFQDALQTFDAAAQTFRQQKARQMAGTVAGAHMVNALTSRALERRAAQETEQEYARAQSGIAELESASVLEHTAQHLSLSNLQWTRKVTQAKRADEQAQAEYLTAKNNLAFARAAQLQDAIDGATGSLAQLEADAHAASEGLLPFRQTAERNGALLKLAIRQREDALQTRLDELVTAKVTRDSALTRSKAEAQDASKCQDSTTKEQARLQAQEEMYIRELARLTDENCLRANEEPPDAAARWRQEETQQSEMAQAQERQRQHLLASAEQLRHENLSAIQSLMQLDAQITERNVFIGQGHAERETLSQTQVVLQAAQVEAVDIESPALPNLLAQFRDQAAVEISRSDVLLADLNAKAKAIQDRGVAGADPDVDLVVQLLRDADVRSARPFKDYISQTLLDASHARTLVMSDPARFLGVMVAEVEMDKVKLIKWGERKPFLPVMVSAAVLDPAASRSDVVTVAPFSDASYNKAAAASLAQTLNQSIEQELERRQFYAKRQADATEALSQLLAFVSKYGDGALAEASTQVANLNIEREATSLQISATEERIRLEVAQAEACLTQGTQHREKANAAWLFAKELARFISDLYSQRAARLLRLERLVTTLEDAKTRKAAADEAIRELNGQAQQDDQLSYRLAVDLLSFSQERSAVTLFDEVLLNKGCDEALDLESSRTSYKGAEETFKTNERDRLGVLHTLIEAQRTLITQKTTELQQNYSQVTREQMTPFMRVTDPELLKKLEDELERLTATKGAAGSRCQAVEEDVKTWRAKNVTRPATPDMEALDDEALAHAIAQANIDATAAADRESRAILEAKQAKRKVDVLGNLLRADETQAKTLISVMELPEPPDPQLIVLAAQNLGVEHIQYEPVVLDEQSEGQTSALVQQFTSQRKAAEEAGKAAQKTFQKLQTAASRKELQEVEPELSAQMVSNDCDAACLDSTRLLEGLTDRIGTTQSSLNDMQADFDACLEEILNLARTGISLLNSATNKKVPDGAPYVAGKPVLKMRANFSSISAEVRKQTAQYYLDHLIDTNVIPANGADLVAEVLMRMPNNKTLGLQILKMVLDESQQYVTFDKITNSGGEGVVMAMFLYAVISQLRAETQAKSSKVGGGPLILDNPFAKATSPSMWKAQRLLSRAMGLQLIFATAIQDFNALGEFDAFVRLRKAGQNTKTGRQHLELMKQTFLPEAVLEGVHV